MTTNRLTDDEIAKLRERTRIDAASHLHLVARDTITAMLDEIEERRRIDARRLADAEQAFRDSRRLGYHVLSIFKSLQKSDAA